MRLTSRDCARHCAETSNGGDGRGSRCTGGNMSSVSEVLLIMYELSLVPVRAGEKESEFFRYISFRLFCLESVCACASSEVVVVVWMRIIHGGRESRVEARDFFPDVILRLP